MQTWTQSLLMFQGRVGPPEAHLWDWSVTPHPAMGPSQEEQQHFIRGENSLSNLYATFYDLELLPLN